MKTDFGNGEQDLDVAIVKATNHVESAPKERHIRSIVFSLLIINSLKFLI